VPKKKVSTQRIVEYLARYGWAKSTVIDEVVEKEGLVVTGWVSPLSPEGHLLMIDPMVERHGMVFKVKELASAPPDATPSDRLSALLMAIAALNGRLIMGAFALNPTDGELLFTLGVPIDSDDLKYEDFAHCLLAIQTTVDAHAAKLRGIIDGTVSLDEVLG
jgi:hypothetical protein